MKKITNQELIEITSSNYSEFKNLDVVAFSLAHAGAQGEGGGIYIITNDKKLYHTNIVKSISLNEAFKICPSLKECRFEPWRIVVPSGWTSFYMGGGNFLVVKNGLKKYLEDCVSLYNEWKDILLQIDEI